MDEDVEDFVFYGTPIEREEDTSGRKRRAIAEAGQLRSLPPWKQEVRDEEGRKRFHGAFTGGFSAGYFNTAGSKEGWAPKTFTSSRKNRAEVKEQSIYNFLDDEDMTGMGGHALETSLKFDTFGFTAAELARKQAEKEQEQRPSTIPGPIPDELVLPAANSIGVKLLLKMGWRRGHSIRETHADSLSDARREARKAFLAFSVNEGESKPAEAESRSPHLAHFTERSNDDFITSQSTHVYVPNPKQNLHGLGYDPFKHAPEFRDRKRLNESTSKDRSSRSAASGRRNLLASNSGKYAPGFGIGALEELDVEDEDIYASGFDYAETEVEEVETTKAVNDTKHRPEPRKRGALSGFKVASSSGYDLERFNPPLIPPDFEPLHKFPFPLETANQFDESPPLEVPPPEDNTLRLLIDGFATLVARCGKLFEDLSKEKNRSNPFFSFLDGGNGHNYYLRKLWEEKQKKADLFKQDDMKASSSAQKMTAEARGRILGEKSLEKSFDNSSSYVSAKETVQLQSNLSDTFTKPASQVGSTEHEKPFKADPAKQERFEQFLKDKYQGGLRSTFSRGNNAMSEADRARERLDFDAAAEAIAKGEWNPNVILQSTSHNVTVMKTGEQVSISGVEKREDEEKLENKIYPKREEYQWRPYPILCKRFDITDPFMGKPPPMPRARSRMDSLIFTADPIMTLKNEVTKDLIKPSMPISRSEPQGTGNQLSEKEPDVEPNNTSVQRPVDLYKAIFSDDSDDDGDNASFKPVNDSENREGVNTTLNRLIAGDFLESLGKELGLEVPKDAPPLNKVNGLIYSKETIDNRDTKPQAKSEKSTSALEMSNQHSEFKEVADRKAVSGDGDVPNPKSPERNLNSGLLNGTANERVLDHGEKVEEEKTDRQSKRRRSHTKRHRRESSASDTDSSSHRESSYHSRSRREKKGASSEGKIRKHSSHHIHKRNRSPVSSDENDQKSRNRKRHSGYSKSHGHSKHR